MVITTHPGACPGGALCAEDLFRGRKRRAIAKARKHKDLRFSIERAVDAFELVIFDTSSVVKLPRRWHFSTRGMEDRPEVLAAVLGERRAYSCLLPR
jgi:hypothetical protein